MPGGVFKVHEFLDSQGLKLTGREGDALLVETSDGKSGKFIPSEFLQGQGVNPKDISLEINTVDNPIPDSPVGLFDRVKLSLGNERGGVEYLKRKFEGVTYNPDQGILVKDKGAWHKVDPDQLGGDPWSLSEAIADTAEFVGGSTLQVAGSGIAVAQAAPAVAAGAEAGAGVGSAFGPVGAAAGAAIGGGAVSIAAAGIGGAAGKAAASSVLGRLVGTYKPVDAQDELEDIGLEGLFAAGGQALALGAKPALKSAVQAFKNIGKWGSETTKDALAATLGRTTAAGEEATRYMFDNADDVARTIKSLRPESKGTADLISKAASKQVEASTHWLEKANAALPTKFGEMLDDLAKQADEVGFKVNVGERVSSALSQFEEKGFGRVVKGRLLPLSEEQVAERFAQGLPVEALDQETFKQVAQIYEAVRPFSKVGELQGGQAAKALAKMNKLINSTFSDNLPPVVARAKGVMSSATKQEIGEAFEKAGLQTQWAGMNQLYQRYGDAVGTARKLLQSDGGPERFYQSLFSGAGKKATLKGEADLLEELAGEVGTQARRRITNLEAAKRFAPILPKLGLAQTAAGSAGTYSALSGGFVATNPVTTALIASTFSPRTMLNATRGYKAMSAPASKYALTLVQALKTLPPASLKKALADPHIIRGAAQETMKAMYGEDEEVMRILQEGGV